MAIINFFKRQKKFSCNFVPVILQTRCAAPSYITDLIKPYKPGRLLISSNQFLLSTSKFNLKTYGGRSFGGFLVLRITK